VEVGGLIAYYDVVAERENLLLFAVKQVLEEA
jgi:hypothetical protein